MRKRPSLVCMVAAIALPCVAATAAHAQAPYQAAPPPSSPAAAPPPAGAPPAIATDPSAPAPAPPQPAPAPGYYPPPGYMAPAPYPAPPGYYPPPGYAQPGYYPPPGYYAPGPVGPPPGYHEHDGFYMRLTTGITVLNASYSTNGIDNSITGAGVGFSMAFGGSITPNLVLYGEFVTSSALEPNSKRGGTSNTLTGYNVDLFGIGPGVAYFLVPANVYFSGTLAFSQLTESYNGSSNSSSNNNSVDLTNMGIGASFMVGKEWWVSTNWGLGVAGMLHLASMKMKNYDSRATAEAISILFSATCN